MSLYILYQLPITLNCPGKFGSVRISNPSSISSSNATLYEIITISNNGDMYVCMYVCKFVFVQYMDEWESEGVNAGINEE